MQNSNQTPVTKKDQSFLPLKHSWFVPLLGILLAGSLALNFVQFLPSLNTSKTIQKDTQQNSLSEFDQFNRTMTFGGITWIGRVIELERDGELYPGYELVQVDATGKESVVHETSLDSFWPIINWTTSSSPSGYEFIFDEYQGYSEGGGTTSIAFKDGEETIRSNYDNYGQHVQNFTFKSPDSPTYGVTLQTSDTCRLSETDFQNRNYIQEGAETDLIGVTLTSTDGSQTFELPNPQSVPCAVVDGITSDPTIFEWDIKTSASGIAFTLPGRIRAFISIDKTTNEVNVTYY